MEGRDGERPRRLLIVDDEADMVAVLRLLFTHPSIAIESAADGLAGVEKAWSFKPHAMLVDIRLPRKDGFDVFIDLRRAAFAPRILLMSAHADAGLMRLATELGAYACFAKPFSASFRGSVLDALGLAPPER